MHATWVILFSLFGPCINLRTPTNNSFIREQLRFDKHETSGTVQDVETTRSESLGTGEPSMNESNKRELISTHAPETQGKQNLAEIKTIV